MHHFWLEFFVLFVVIGLVAFYFNHKPKLRVRTISRSGKYVLGTVDKVMEVDKIPGPMTYWSVVWDDEPKTWSTVPSSKFIWHDGFWTLIERQ